MLARTFRTVVAVVALGVVGVLAPIAVSPAAAVDIDYSLTVTVPSEARVGDIVTLRFNPLTGGEYVPYEVTFDVPAGFEVYNTFESDDVDMTCDVDDRTVTCPGWYLYQRRVQLLAVTPGTYTHTLTIAGTEGHTDPTPDPTPNTATASTTVVASTKDMTISPAAAAYGTVGEPTQLVVVAYDNPRPSGDPAWYVDATITFDVPDELQPLSTWIAPADWPDPDVDGPFFDQGSCTIDGQDVTCSGLTRHGGYTYFSLEVLPLEDGTFPISATFTPGPNQSEPTPDPRPNTATFDVEVAPSTNGAITGQVNDGVGPVQNVTVTAYPVGSATPAATDTTDATGAYALGSLAPGSYELRYAPPGGSPFSTQWKRTDGVATTRANAHAIAVSSASNVAVSMTLEDLDLSRADLGAGTRSFDSTDQVLYVGEEGEIVLDPGSRRRRVDGVFNDHPTETTYEVTVPNDVTVVSAFPRWGAGGGEPGSSCTTTAHTVECALAGSPMVVINVIPSEAGPFDLVASHTSTTPETVPQVLPDTDTFSIDVTANIGGISGTLVDDSADPVEGAWVLAYRNGDGMFPSSEKAWTISDANGDYAFSGLPSGTYKVFVSPPASSGLSPRWLDNASSRAFADVFQVHPWNVEDAGTTALTAQGIAGTITDGTDPVAGVTVRAFTTDSLWIAAATATTDVDGTYRFALPPGTYHVIASASPSSGLADRWFANTPSRANATTVTVTADSTTTGIDIALPSATSISGTITGPGGAVEGARVVAYAPTDAFAGSFQTLTAGDGTFTLAGIPDGTYKILVVAPAGSGLADEWYDDAASRTTATAVVVSGAAVTGIDATLASL